MTSPVTGTASAGLAGAARGGAVNLVAAGFAGLAGLLITALVARGLGAAEAGVFFAATSAFLLAQMLAKLGTDTGLVYWLARLRAVRRFDLLHRCLRIGLGPVLVGSVVAGLLLFFTAPWLAGLPALTDPHGSVPHAGTFVLQLRVLAVFLPVAAVSDALLSATRGYRTMRPTALVEKTARPALQLVLLLVVAVSASTTAFTLAWVMPYLASVLAAGYFLSTVDRKARSAPYEPDGAADIEIPARLNRAFWRFTAPRALASVGQVALQRLDVLLVAGLIGFPAAALYTVATRFVVVGQLGNQAIGSAVQPRLAERLARSDMAGVRQLYQGSTAWVVLLTWPMFLLVAIYAPVYLRLFGGGYSARTTTGVVALLCLAMLGAAACGMVDMVLAMGGRTSWNLINVGVAFGVNVTLDLLLIPHLGIVGAAVGWAVALLVKNVLPLVQIATVLKLHPFGPGTLYATLLATGCVGVPAAVLRLIVGAGPAGLALSVGIAVPAYLLGCFLLRDPLGLAQFPRRRTARSARSAIQDA